MIDKTRGVSRASLIVFALAACCTATAQADAPIFSESSYSFEASLDQQNSYVGTVQAYDPEWDDFDYILHDSSGNFSINSFHGYIHADIGSLDVGTYTMTVEAVDVFDESSFVDVDVVVTPGPPPEIVNVSFFNYGGGMWMIGGTVDSSTPGGTVKFGGLLNGKSTTYDSSGSFMYMTMILGSGDVSVQAIDSNGQESATVYRHIGN
jgi:hypothetical protein